MVAPGGGGIMRSGGGAGGSGGGGGGDGHGALTIVGATFWGMVVEELDPPPTTAALNGVTRAVKAGGRSPFAGMFGRMTPADDDGSAHRKSPDAEMEHRWQLLLAEGASEGVLAIPGGGGGGGGCCARAHSGRPMAPTWYASRLNRL